MRSVVREMLASFSLVEDDPRPLPGHLRRDSELDNCALEPATLCVTCHTVAARRSERKESPQPPEVDPPSGLEPRGLGSVFGEAALEQGRVWRIGPSRPLVTRGKFEWRQRRRGRWRLGWSSVIAVWEEVQPQVLGALSLVLRPGFKLARFQEVLVQEFGPTNGTPKKEPQLSGLASESCCIHLPTVRDCPVRWAEGQDVLTIGCSGISTR